MKVDFSGILDCKMSENTVCVVHFRTVDNSQSELLQNSPRTPFNVHIRKVWLSNCFEVVSKV